MNSAGITANSRVKFLVRIMLLLHAESPERRDAQLPPRESERENHTREGTTNRKRERERRKKRQHRITFPNCSRYESSRERGSLAAAKYPGIGVESSANRRLSQFPGVPTRLNFYRRCRSTSSSTGGGGGLPLVVDGRWPIVSRDIG